MAATIPLSLSRLLAFFSSQGHFVFSVKTITSSSADVETLIFFFVFYYYRTAAAVFWMFKKRPSGYFARQCMIFSLSLSRFHSLAAVLVRNESYQVKEVTGSTTAPLDTAVVVAAAGAAADTDVEVEEDGRRTDGR